MLLDFNFVLHLLPILLLEGCHCHKEKLDISEKWLSPTPRHLCLALSLPTAFGIREQVEAPPSGCDKQCHPAPKMVPQGRLLSVVTGL